MYRTATGNTTITIDNCAKGDLLRLQIIGNNSVFEGLVPSNTLVPSNSLVPKGDSRIIVTDSNNNSVTYELGVTEVLRSNSEVNDEYILEDGIAKVIRRVNADGTTKEIPIEEDLGEFSIELTQGTNTISILNYIAIINVGYAEKSKFTDTLATKVEVGSKITQTADEIKSLVSANYETKENSINQYSQIRQKADEINLEVSKKVGNDEIISKINQSSESISIDANRVSLERKNNRFNS